MFIVNGAKNLASRLLTSYLLGKGADSNSLQKVAECMSTIPEGTKKLGKGQQLKYLIAYNKLQDLIRDLSPALVYGPEPENPILSPEKEKELDQIANDCAFYARFAVGCYGDKVLYEQGTKGNKNVLSLLNPNDHDEEFVKFAKFHRRQLVHSDWTLAHAYEPAQAIVVLKERKEVLVVVRGSVDIGDWLTDFIATYQTFSVMEDETGSRYIRIHSTDAKNKEEFEKLEISKVVVEQKNPKDKVIYTGRAHSGIFRAGIETYKKLRSKLDDVFNRLPPGYKLSVTGHSLGGGMTQSLTFLFLMCPLKYFQGSDLKGRIHGYAFAPPPIFEKSAAPLLEGFLTNVCHRYDVVPRISFGSLRDLDAAVAALAEASKKDEALEKRLVHFNPKKADMTAQDKEDLKKYQAFFKHLRENVMINDKTTHCGRTFAIQNTDPSYVYKKDMTFTFREVNAEDHCRYILTCESDILTDHYPPKYYEGLNSNLKFLV